jgi:hypothetical protein
MSGASRKDGPVNLRVERNILGRDQMGGGVWGEFR